MPSVISRASSTHVGHFAIQTIQPLTHLIRRTLHPGLPVDQTVTSISSAGRHFKMRHRRWGSDKLVINQCFAQSQYDLPIGAHGVLTQRLYDGIVAAGRTPLIIDCGANIGASALWFSARYPAAHIIAVEPDPENFSLLAANAAQADIDAREGGIAAAVGTARLQPGKWSMSHRTSDHGDGEIIETFTVASLLASKNSERFTPFLLKMDIEGAESSLFDGDVSAFDQFPLIVIEPHDWLFPGQLSSRSFFRFHAAAGREFCMRHENIASVACDASLREMTEGLKN